MIAGLNYFIVMCFAKENSFFRAQFADYTVFVFLLRCFCIK